MQLWYYYWQEYDVCVCVCVCVCVYTYTYIDAYILQLYHLTSSEICSSGIIIGKNMTYIYMK
jgi:hypothetical protein